MTYQSPIEEIQKKRVALQESELSSWGRVREGPMSYDYSFYTTADPYENGGPCNYGGEMWNRFVNEDAPVNEEIRKSHFEWVDNRRAWSGVSKYLQESIEPVVNWRGIRLPDVVPQNCNRAELTEYGPADFTYFITQNRLKTGNPIVDPKEMAGCYRSSIGLGTGGGSCGGMSCSPLGFGFFGF